LEEQQKELELTRNLTVDTVVPEQYVVLCCKTTIAAILNSYMVDSRSLINRCIVQRILLVHGQEQFWEELKKVNIIVVVV
jgi:hypothetical protein